MLIHRYVDLIYIMLIHRYVNTSLDLHVLYISLDLHNDVLTLCMYKTESICINRNENKIYITMYIST